jgi:GGDEF domain-containing protein
VVTISYVALLVIIWRFDKSKKSSEDLKQKLQVEEQKVTVLLSQLRDRERLQLIDIVTGIPNQLKWERDIDNLSKTDDPDPHYQIILIDLDNFREINKTYGHEKGDQVIKEFSRSVFNSMRRDEHIYKNFLRGEDGSSINIGEHWHRFYRKYTGGDEFLLILNGFQPEALGLLARLVRDLLPRINERISKFILEHEVSLSFHAAMCEWIPGDEPKALLERLQAAMLKSVDSSVTRLYFHPPMTSKQFEQPAITSTGRPPRWNPYRDAELLFAKPAIRGDFESLVAALKSIGISEADIAALKGAIEEDQKASQGLGDKISSWLKEVRKTFANAESKVTLDVGEELAKKWLMQYLGLEA